LQNWHLYFFSGASEDFRVGGVEATEGGRTAIAAAGIGKNLSAQVDQDDR